MVEVVQAGARSGVKKKHVLLKYVSVLSYSYCGAVFSCSSFRSLIFPPNIPFQPDSIERRHAARATLFDDGIIAHKMRLANSNNVIIFVWIKCSPSCPLWSLETSPLEKRIVALHRTTYTQVYNTTTSTHLFVMGPTAAVIVVRPNKRTSIMLLRRIFFS